jgi:hypothetical protein
MAVAAAAAQQALLASTCWFWDAPSKLPAARAHSWQHI